MLTNAFALDRYMMHIRTWDWTHTITRIAALAMKGFLGYYMLAHGDRYHCMFQQQMVLQLWWIIRLYVHAFDCAEAQRKSLQKLTTQKSHSFTGGVPPDRFDDMFADASPAGKQYVARRFDDVIGRHESPKRATEKLARQPVSISATASTNAAAPGGPCASSGLDKVHVDEQLQQKLADRLISHAVYSEVEQQEAEACHTGLSQTYSRTYIPEKACAPTTTVLTEPDSHASAEREESAALVASCIGTSGDSQQMRKVCQTKHTGSHRCNLSLHANVFPAGM